MKHDHINLISAALIALLVLVFACQPIVENVAADAVGSSTSNAGASATLSQWMPSVLAIEGACDAALFIQVGPVLTRLKVEATAGHTQGEDDVGATVALESALASFACKYERGRMSSCEPGPGVFVEVPEAPDVEAPFEDSSSISIGEDASSDQDTSEGEVQ